MAGVTLQSIAEELGVSRTTVSNAYNRPDQLTAELRSRILDTARRLGYGGPDAAARTLRTGRRNAIGLVFTEDLPFVFSDPVTTAFLAGVADAAARASTGLTLLPVPSGLDPHDSALPTTAVDGHLVFSVPSDHPVLELLPAMPGPTVVIDEPDDGRNAGFVGIDDRAGARLAIDHLVGLRHTRIALLTHRLGVDSRPGPVDELRREASTVRVARLRLEGSLAALDDAGFEIEEIPVWEAARTDPDAGRAAVSDLLDAHPDLTAIMCFTDQLAIGAAQAARVRGRTVPDDLSIIGFDDVPRAATWSPPLTTIRQPLVEKGRLAAQMLFDAIEGDTPGRRMLPIDLVVRESTAPASERQ